MLKGGSSASRSIGVIRSNPSMATSSAGDPNPKSSSLNAAGKKRSETATTSASRSKDTTKQNSAQSPQDISDTGSEETDLSTSEGDDSSWISWFCGLRGNELLCEVDEDYIQDDFNLCGLQGQVPFYDYALDMILDNDSLSGEVDGEEHNEIESAAELLYGLIHARYIVTSKGLNAMHEKYKRADFGRCPRVFCGGQQCLPVGTSDIPRNGSVKIYCPKCEDLYFPRCKYQSNLFPYEARYKLDGEDTEWMGRQEVSYEVTFCCEKRKHTNLFGWWDIGKWKWNYYSYMDGSYIGTTFPHLYLMTYPSGKPAKPVQNYVPRVFGFKLHKASRS